VSYRVTRVVGRTTDRSFRITYVAGRTTSSSSRSFRITYVAGRAVLVSTAGGTFKLTRVVGRARAAIAPTGSVVEPFQLVQLPDGVWSQVSGPTVVLNAINQFIAPGVPNGADLLFQAEGSSATFHVNPHTAFRPKAATLDPLYVSPHPEPRPTVS
jgi:hypothetical protein